MLPAAPPRFSTSTGWPHFSPIFCAMTRPRMSVVPPGAQGTTMRTALVGYVCAAACGRRTSAAMRKSKRIGAPIIAAAARAFAEHGFDVPMADRRRMREQVLAQLFAGRWKPQWDALLVER